jgi:hypothetical protein
MGAFFQLFFEASPAKAAPSRGIGARAGKAAHQHSTSPAPHSNCAPQTGQQATNQGVVGSNPAGRAKNQRLRKINLGRCLFGLRPGYGT